MNEPLQATGVDAGSHPQRALAELTARECAMLNSLVHGIVAIDMQEKITLFNPAAERMFGYAAAEILGSSPSVLYTPASLQKMLRVMHEKNLPLNMRGMIALTSSPMSEWTYLRKDGSTLPGRLSITELCNEDGHTFGYLGLITDLSDRNRAIEIEQREQALIAHISRGTNAAIGEQFFEQLAAELRGAIGVRYSNIYELLPDRPGMRGRIVNTPSFSGDDVLDFSGTPLESSLHEGRILHLTDMQNHSKAPRVSALRIEESITVPLIASNGKVLGALIVAHDEPLSEPELTQRLLEIFAVRASSELERLHNERVLQARELEQNWLYEASEQIHAQMTVDDFAKAAVAAGARHHSAPRVTMTLNARETYRLLAYAGSPEHAPFKTIYPRIMNSYGEVLSDKHSILLLQDFQASVCGSDLYAEAVARDTRAIAIVGLIENGQDIGAITFDYSDAAKLEQLDLNILGTFGRSVALGLARALQRQQLEYQADHDGLTGLFNRTVLHREFDRWREQGGKQTALLLLDLDRFKEVNDTLGHHVGDALLRQIGERLRVGINYSKATLTRLGGDEFAILLRSKKLSAERANVLAENILTALRRPFQISGVNLEIGASVGVALYPEHGEDSHALLRSADVAMYDAKRSGGGVAFYNRDLDLNSPERLALISDFSNGIRQRELELFYQPKIDLRTHCIVGYEGLLRWRHPRLGLLTPDRFLPLIEMSDAIHDLSRAVLEIACTQMHAWIAAGETTTLAVNLSARNLIDDRIVRHLTELIHQHQIPGERLELEITETALIQDPEHALHLLERIAALGVALSIDDFGTGYSSLVYLRSMPISTLKIDRTFIRDMLVNPQDEQIVSSIIQLAHGLGLNVVAEGVESADVLTRLHEMACDQAQGYYFSKPLPLHELQQWRANNFPQLADNATDTEFTTQ